MRLKAAARLAAVVDNAAKVGAVGQTLLMSSVLSLLTNVAGQDGVGAYRPASQLGNSYSERDSLGCFERSRDRPFRLRTVWRKP